MKVTNNGRGIHKREVRGVERLRDGLPSQWFAYTNLDVVIGLGKPREIDVIVVADRRIFFLDIKDWGGRIESRDGRWYQNGQERERSPVAKVSETARDLYPILKSNLARRSETKDLPVPRIHGLVILTGRADITGIAGVERESVLTIDEYISKVIDDATDRQAFGNVATEFLNRPLTGVFWREKLSQFFTGSGFEPGKRRFERFIAEGTPSFVPPHDIYQEFDAHEEGSATSLGTLRLWNFTKCPDVRFQTEEGRQEIAGREREVFNWLRDRSDDVERTLLPPKVDDPERGVAYWEIYDRRRRMQRLSQFAATDATRLLPAGKIELARQLLAALAALHQQDAVHLDLAGHSIWLEAPTSVKFSHLLAARIPEGRSLGKSRFQFLASVGLPEEFYGVDEGPKRRDVFLAGVAVHTLLFGRAPDGSPPEWDSAIDASGDFLAVHDWLGEALEHSPSVRFSDAVVAHAAFLKATAARPSQEELLEALERFRGSIRSQRQLAGIYPIAGEPLAETDALDVWRSHQAGQSVVVKLWKQAAWGDTRREASSILSFLKRASDQKADQPDGVATVRDVFWLGDSFVVIQDWVEGETLRTLINQSAANLGPEVALNLMARMLAIVDGLHQSGSGHGDLKPENIVVTEKYEPVLIDALDYATVADGDIVTDSYAPDGGDKLERDRFAATKIADELFSRVSLPAEELAQIERAIKTVREKAPALATLDPLLEAIESIQATGKSASGTEGYRSAFRVHIKGAETGPIESDEGLLYLRLHRNPTRQTVYLHIRGACEEIALRLNDQGKIVFGRRNRLEQRWIARSGSAEFHRLAASLTVEASEHNDFGELEPVLDSPEVSAAVEAALRGDISEAVEEVVAEELPPVEDAAEDVLAEEISEAPAAPSDLDVRLLWRTLIDIENELTTEAVAQQSSMYDRKSGRHRVSIELDRGEFDFAREDRVGVEVQNPKGDWRRIGELDVQLSRLDQAVFDAHGHGTNRDGVIDAGHRLRFTSHFEVQSLKRRTHAVERVLGGNGRLKNLLSVFEPRSLSQPDKLNIALDTELLESYDLNSDQLAAFDRIVNTRPVGLLQGPPGTGKTRFIAALAHYALTKGIVQNVLLTSQSHEAVNTAADAVLKHFRITGIEPSLLRVAMSEDLASPDLRPYHTQRVEQAFKDRFRAAFRERIAIAGAALGLSDAIVESVVILETVIGPLCRKIAELSAAGEGRAQRSQGVRETLDRHIESLGLLPQTFADDLASESLYDRIADELTLHLSRASGAAPDQIKRLRAAASIGSDFVGSVSSAQRSFETFLAGTRQIVVGTCVGLGRTSLGLTSTPFDLVIVDEAARCTAGELLVPLQSARWAVLVGDQAQLEPLHKPDVVNLAWERTRIPKREIQRSDFERVFRSDYGELAGCRLRTQYRMLPPIGRLVSEVFYSDLKLAPGRHEPVVDPDVMPPSLDRSILWVETDSLGSLAFEHREGASSRANRTEADAILGLLEQWHSHAPFQEWLAQSQASSPAIGVICMYAGQRDFIKRKIRQSPLHYLLDGAIRVGTVDSYQGKENPIVILSLVRNNDVGPSELGVKRISEGFLRTPNRINVSASRAMDRLVIVGSRHRWPANGPMGHLAKVFEQIRSDGDAAVMDATTLVASNSATVKRAVSRRGNAEVLDG